MTASTRIGCGAGRGAAISFTFDGVAVSAHAGETVAAALVAAGIAATRVSRSGTQRGYFCGMGVCFECLVTVNGRPNRRACMETVAPGMVVETMRAPEQTP
jgi:predicted molibdopterin-dependent oxidoreductase YjgC